MDLYFLEPMSHLHLLPKEWQYSHKIKYSKFGRLSFNLSSIQTLLGEKPDRASELPRKIIDIILSKLISSQPHTTPSRKTSQIRFTTKTAIKNTSILSKRWLDAWTTCPKLVFLRDEFRTYQSFIKFVDRTLAMRGQAPLTTFELYWTKDTVDASCISTWLYYAMQCNVQEIALQLYCGEVLELPWSLFRCRTLKVLHILAAGQAYSPWSSPCFLRLPNSINLKNLRCLDLQYMQCSNRLLQKLISSSPLLESLKIGTCSESIQISAPNLKTLHLYLTNGPVHIWAPKLESFVCNLFSYGKISTSKIFELLVDARVTYHHKETCSTYKLEVLLTKLCNAKVLSLNEDFIEALSKGDLTKLIFPTFYYLKHLSIETPLATENINVIIMLLQRCPALKKLVLYNTKKLRRRIEKNFVGENDKYLFIQKLEDDISTLNK